MASEVPEFTFTVKEVAVHEKTTDAWIIIHGEVFDITKYMHDHPGGLDVLANTSGTDATAPFDNAGHSEDTLRFMASLRIGKIKGYSQVSRPKPVKPEVEATSNAVKSSTSSKVIGLATVAMGAMGLCGGVLIASPDVFFILKSLYLRGRASRIREYGFLEGILIASAVFGIAGGILSIFFMKTIHSNNTFKDYPSRFKVPKTVTPDLLREKGWLHPSTYQALPLVIKQLVAPSVYRLVFELPTKQTVLGLPIGQHVSISAEIDGKSVIRSYTPVSNNADRGVMELVIRCYPDGVLTSRYLQKLHVGDEVLFRGPKGAMRYRRGLCQRIGMLAGGTGITPMYQIIRAICEDDTDTTQVSLIYANRSEADMLLRKELESFAMRYPKNLRLHYLLETPPEVWAYGAGRVTKDVMKEKFPSAAPDSKVMMCGPPGMVKAANNMLAELGFEKPSSMSKMSDQVFVF